MTTQFIYFIRPVGMDGPIKIGCSALPENRQLQLMAWSPFPLEIVATIPGSFELERNIHQCFADLHSHGEWFRPGARLTAAISAISAGQPVGVAIDLTDRRGSIGAKRTKRPDTRIQASYALRLSWAARKLRTDSHYFSRPHDVDAIMVRWRGYGWNYRGGRKLPTEAEMARLDQVLAEPSKHFVARSIHRVAA